MKLDEKAIEELVEETLKEVINVNILPKALTNAGKSGYPQVEPGVKKLAKNDGKAKDITSSDIEKALVDDEKDEIDAINFLRQNIAGNAAGKPKDVFAKDLNTAVSAVADKQKKVDFQSTGDSKIKAATDDDQLFQFDITNAKMQTSDPSMSPALKNVFDFLQIQGQTLSQRILKLSEFSDNLQNAAKNDDAAKKYLQDLGLLKFTQFTMAMDYLNTISKNVDSGSGAYFFETFLAALAGGNVAGKETTDEGGQGGADFTFGNNPNARGSSKFLKKGSKSSQSPKGFERKEFVHYVVARKVLDQGTGPSAPAPSSLDVDQIVGFDIHYMVLQVIRPKTLFQLYSLDKSNSLAKVGDTIYRDEGSSKPIITQSGQKGYIGTLKITSVYQEQFKKVLETAVGNLEKNFGNAFEKFKKTFDTVAAAKESIGSYASKGEQAAGNDAIDKLLAYQTAMKSLFTDFDELKDGGYEAPDSEKVKKLGESKLSELDKLILEVLKENT